MRYEGGYDAVRRYVRSWRRERSAVTADAYVPLSFAPGEAYQFDWSHEVVLINGVTHKIKVAQVRLCHSRMMFVRAYPRESQEMVFDAHDRAFAFFKGVRGGVGDRAAGDARRRAQAHRLHPHRGGDEQRALHGPGGDTRPYYASAAGRVVLAARSDAWLSDYLATTELTRLRPGTPHTPATVRKLVEAVRRDGVSESCEEVMDGGAGIAAPLTERDGRLAGVLVIGAVSTRAQRNREAYQAAVKRAAREISWLLGGRENGAAVSGKISGEDVPHGREA